jgi:hypothetical protein
MKYSKITYTKGKQNFAKNCLKLARILETQVPAKQFDMLFYGRRHACSTHGCALGWAAMSNLFPGLQYTLRVIHDQYIVPVINGKVSFWEDAGVQFFGEAYCDIMLNTKYRSPKQVAKELRQWAKENAT